MTQIYINGKDAQSTWGIVTDTSTLAALLTPPPQKELITNESRLTNGMRVYSGATYLSACNLLHPRRSNSSSSTIRSAKNWQVAD